MDNTRSYNRRRPIPVTPISHRLCESGVRVLFENFGEVTLVRIAQAPDGQSLKIDQRPSSEYTMVYGDAGKNYFTLTKSNAGNPVTHYFGIAVVTMPDEEGASKAIKKVEWCLVCASQFSYAPSHSLLMDITSIDGSVVEVKILGRGSSGS
ncbi:hypothetical protein JMJ35_008153 [Cladonia borealis]|uniref:Uncharacterized protein n=1 Tax=Cladonia borealis TaxID=184061 RepID=A0AA39V3D2_9LECA|nr:hypothetical protein JMJ35_008153 [Cladonia borealis]